MPSDPPKAFQWDGSPPKRLKHSAAKHCLIREYVRQYLDILTNVPFRRELRLTVFDGFAGGGTFVEDGEIVSGTPLILAEEIIAAHQRRANRDMKFLVDLWVVEKKRSNFEALEYEFERRQLRSIFPGEVHLRKGRFEQPLLEALQRLKAVRGGTGRSIFLFDQTGYAQVNLEIIREIFSLFQRPEVILTFAVSWLADLARADPGFLKRVASLGIKEGELRELLEAKEEWSPRYGAQKWLRAYLQRYVGAPHDTSFFLRSEESHKDLWLLHFSRQPRARDAMLGVHYQFANQAHFYGKEGFEMLGYDPTVDASQCRLFGFTDSDACRSTDALLADIPKAMTDRGGSAGIPAETLFARELNDATVTFDMFKKGAVAARAEGLIEIYTQDGRLRPSAKLISKDDVLKLPSQSTIWHLLK
jgi:three-Cys-motif partner protein